MKVQKICVAVKDLTDCALGLDVVKAMGIDNAEVRLVHVSLHENFGRARFPLEAPEEASHIVEAAVAQFRWAGFTVHGKVCRALVGKESDAIVDDATDWGADAIVLGRPHHGDLAIRMRGSVVQRVIQSSPCPVVVAASAASLSALSPSREQAERVA